MPCRCRPLQHFGGVRIGRPGRRIDHPVVERFGVVVGHPGLAQHVQIRLAMQVRCQVTVDPRVVGLRCHLDVLADRRGQPAHQLGLDMAIDLTLVDFDAVNQLSSSSRRNSVPE